MIQPNSTTKPHQHCHPKPPTNLYNKVLTYNKFTLTPDFKKHEQVLKTFVQYSDKRVLFVFGPSGSGKKIFVQTFLRKHCIPLIYVEQQVSYNVQDMRDQWGEEGEFQENKIVMPVRELIMKSVSKSDTNMIQIYNQFPIPNSDSNFRQIQSLKTFKHNFFKSLPKSGCKIIFLLNSQIYNRYFIIPKDSPTCISQLTLKPYSITQTKSILKDFIKQYPIFEWTVKNKDVLDQIIQISNGDMRKVMLNVYKFSIDGRNGNMEYMSKEEKVQYKMKLKNQQKFPLFHLLGKYLYAKRYDTVQKKDRAFSKQELIKLDPPFYFNPVQMYYKSCVPLNIFTQLLFENYTAKIASIQDARQITKMFSALDQIFPVFITNKKIDSLNEQMQQLYVSLLTWGIILKNKSSSNLQKRFTNFRKSQSKYVANQITAKKNLLKTYFPLSSRQNLVRWGYIVRNSKTHKKFLITDLIRKRNRMINMIREDNEKVLGEQQQQQIIKYEYNNYNNDFLRNYEQKKKKSEKQAKILNQMMHEDQSDIDEEN